MVTNACPAGSSASGFLPVPLSGLASAEPLQFPLYLRTARQSWVLYRPATSRIGDAHIGRLTAGGIVQLFIREVDREQYLARVSSALEDILSENDVPLGVRVDVLQGIATQMAESLLAGPPDPADLARARKVMVATGGLMLREQKGFSAIRRMLSGSRELAHHSLTVGFLSMGLARLVHNIDAEMLVTFGLAGLLHDVGKIGCEELGSDPDHPQRGAHYLESVGLPPEVVAAARSHHERWDGSGYPHGLSDTQIPEAARIVGLVDTFDRVYSGQTPRVGIYDAMRILAQAYRGCFDNQLATGLVSLFG